MTTTTITWHKPTNYPDADVRVLIAAGMQGKHIAAKFGINQSMVSSIKTGKYAERKNPPINQELTP